MMSNFDQLIITKILNYFNLIEIHQQKSLSKDFYTITESFIPYQLYHSHWINQMINSYYFHYNHHKFSKFNLNSFLKLINLEIIKFHDTPPWIERLLLDASRLGNLNCLIWIINTYFKNKFNLRRTNRCLVYTAHHQNLSMVDFLIKYIINYTKNDQDNEYKYDNYPDLRRTYIECIRLRNSIVFQHLWQSFPIYDKKIINQFLNNCEMYHSIKIYFIIMKFLKEDHFRSDFNFI